MRIRSRFTLCALATLLLAACNVSNKTTATDPNENTAEATSCFGEGVDSIKVEVSTKVGGTRSIMLLDNGEAVAHFENSPTVTLPDSTAQELGSLADSLFVNKTREIILSKESGQGRTDYPIFTVTLYREGEEETTRYDMGTEEGNITHCTEWNIHYSPEFRHFKSQVFEILNQ